jgi:hypothetical protein
MRQPQLFLLVHAAARGLLSIPKRRIEYRNSRFVHNDLFRGTGLWPASRKGSGPRARAAPSASRVIFLW